MTHLGGISDPFLRALLWGSLWQSVQVTDLDPRRYTELSTALLENEKDEMILAQTLGIVPRRCTSMSWTPTASSDAGAGSDRRRAHAAGIGPQPAHRLVPRLSGSDRERGVACEAEGFAAEGWIGIDPWCRSAPIGPLEHGDDAARAR